MPTFDRPPESLEEVIEFLNNLGIPCSDETQLFNISGVEVVRVLQKMGEGLTESLALLDRGQAIMQPGLGTPENRGIWAAQAISTAQHIRTLLYSPKPRKNLFKVTEPLEHEEERRGLDRVGESISQASKAARRTKGGSILLDAAQAQGKKAGTLH